jgi:hypothetical protein
MSKHDKIAKLKEYIKNFVIKELEKDEEIDEVSTTVTAGGSQGTGIHYDTPKAFSSGSAVGHKSPEVGGYKKVNESYVSSGNVSDVFLKLKSKGFGNKKFGDISKELSKYYKTPGLADVMASMFKEIWMKGKKKEAEKEVLDWIKTVAKKSKLESVKEDIDVGHKDDEPDMLKSTAMEIVDYGKKLYDALDKYDEMEDEIDFPNWWQSKLIVAKDYLQKAYHYLDSEEKKDGVQESINEKLSVDPRKVYGGTGAKQGMVLTAQKGLQKILDLSKKNPSNVFKVSDDNYTNFGPYYVKNGKIAKYTVANPNYDLQKNKVRSLKVPSDVILKFTINEGYGEMMDELEKIYRPTGAPPIAKEALKDLADEYDIGRVLYAARTNRKSFMEVMDMKIDQLQSQYVNKKHIDTIKRGKNLKEVKKQEVSALQKLHKDLEKLKNDYIKIARVGDKTLMDREYNNYYETILTARKEIGKLLIIMKNKEMLGEGRYHDWRNDESLTPKQKIGQSVKEIRDSLNELDKTIKMNLKLKTELNVDSRDYWKNTHKALTKISERLVKMANKVGNLK